MYKKLSRTLLALSLLVMVIVPHVSSTQAQDGPVFRIWYYESENAIGKSWDYALEQFAELHPEVTIEFELKVFEQIQESALMVLNSDEAPDVMEINKGNATAGLYASQGLLTDLSQVAEEQGWLDVLSPSILTTSRYDENGIMGNGPIYGVTTYGEFVMVYYNKDMFAEYGLEVPTSLEEFEAAAQTFVDAGITPIALGAGSQWPVTQNWYEMALYKADRNLISDFQFLQGDFDFHNEAFTFGADKFAEQVEAGFYSPNANGIIYEDVNAAFVQGEYPMNLTGSWMFGAFVDQITDFDWGIFVLPGKQFNTGSGGNLLVVPENAQNKDLAYEFISLALASEAQTIMANTGGIPVNADLDAIEDEKIRELNAAFADIVANDGLAFYPDWPVPGFMDALGGGLQELFDGSVSTDTFLEDIAVPYEDYKSSLE